MGTRGPVPKRSTERRRRNVTDANGEPDEVEVVQIDKPRAPVPNPNPHWHSAALALWNSAVESGQSEFYEPSDWATLALICSQVSQYYRDDFIIEKVKQPMVGGEGGGEELVYGSRPMSGAELSTVLKGLASLAFTEGDRRRMRLELERIGEDEGEQPTADGVIQAQHRFLGGA